MRKIDTSVLRYFCSNKSLYTREPFVWKGATYASDGYCFLALSDIVDGVTLASDDQRKYILEYNTRLNQHPVDEWFTIDGVSIPALIKCSVCHGRGRLQTGLCPYCMSGFYRPTYDFQVKELYVNGWKLIDLLGYFSNVEFALLDTGKRKVIKARFDEGYAYLAAWMKGSEADCKVCVL